ncbi:MAG: GntP family permease, partial [Verrucomicrobiales bacterium]|nr:GntP family permease [Verrucomicrobiales bacterium]
AESYEPVLALAAGVVVVVGGLMLARLHAFLALLLAAIVVGWLSPGGQFPEAQKGPHSVQAVEQVAIEFGRAVGNIGIVIALASIIGVCLLESGAAERIVRGMLAWFGAGRAAWALLASGFLLSIPVFFDTVFLLLLPIARALALRTGRDFMLYVMALAGGAAVTHSLVPPTPGPLLVADALGLETGEAILAGLMAGLPLMFAVYGLARWFNVRVPVPLRASVASETEELRGLADREAAALPPLGLAVLPILLPTALIALSSVGEMLGWETPVASLPTATERTSAWEIVLLLGNKNIALLLGAAVALWLYRRGAKRGWAGVNRKLGTALETAGVIILITAAGGAFGGMIRHSGVGEVLKDLVAAHGLNLVLLGWLVAAVVRVVQGSATVAMITGAALMRGVIGDGAALPFHPAYIYLAVGFGSMIFSWMNDSGFWLVSRMCGFTERETLKSWTLLVTGISLVGLVEVLLLSTLLPLR